jgi:nitrile hydratase accessory protein
MTISIADSTVSSAAVPALPNVIAAHLDLPRDEEGPVFDAPWQAQAFALVVKLAEAGHYTWPEWVTYFSAELASAKDAELRGETVPSYYEHWLTAAEKLIMAKGLATRDQLAVAKFGVTANRACKALK